MWEVDWIAGKGPEGRVMARNLASRNKDSRDWHWKRTDSLVKHGVACPRFGTAWEVDWDKRDGSEKVWARNPLSKRAECREWRWVSKGTLITGGVTWRPVGLHDGRHINSAGYVMLTPKGLTPEDLDLAIRSGLLTRSGNMRVVLEHRLVALKKYGSLAKSQVVRHLNGDKQDNRPENLVTGSHKENHTDHRTAVLRMMYWRERAEAAEKKLAEYER